MSVLEVLAPGLFTTVQDLGRPGFGAWQYRLPARLMLLRCVWEIGWLATRKALPDWK